MNAVRQITGADLRNAQQENSKFESLIPFADYRQRGITSTYYLSEFSGVLCAERILCVAIPRAADVMAPHSIDVPPQQIDKIKLQVGEKYVMFNSMADASFYFHICAIGEYWGTTTRMLIYLRPGCKRTECVTVWRCYFLDANPRDVLVATKKSVQIPVTKNIVFDGAKFTKRHMAKL